MTREIPSYTTNCDAKILRIFLIRHGQTAENSKKILQGHLDTNLNETGEEQAQKLGQYLSQDRGIKFDQAFSSDLKRCQQTLAKALEQYPAKERPDVVLDAGLRERSMGEIQGMFLSDAEAYATKHGKASFRDFGEKPDAFERRLTQTVSNIAKSCADSQNIAIMSHGGSIRQLLKWFNYTEHDMHRIIVFNTSVTIIDYVKDSHQFEVKRVGNTQHLGDGEFIVSDLRLR
ncbi:LANO_0H17326g1_1 [Lachancea nothofagi CBS 11611]|uniref:LANO_0H17326g1_1 n=1 Tax=Lachancea nothofagi CBS 11611 TaxID=1266666 RepID=A0A1G4KMW5_9SACH|nr:LANO_0H17326g1_1 [Lachancea nothofagi CBS 11611]